MPTTKEQVCEVFRSGPNACQQVIAVGGVGEPEANRALLIARDAAAARARLVDAFGADFLERVTVVKGTPLRAETSAAGRQVGASVGILKAFPGNALVRTAKGTLGAVLKPTTGGNARYLLTAEHVMWPRTALPHGTADVQLDEDLVGTSLRDLCGTWTHAGNLLGGSPVADWSLVSPLPACQPIPKTRCDGTVFQLATKAATLKEKVAKCGAKTALRHGQVLLTDACVWIEYQENNHSYCVHLDHHLVITNLPRRRALAADGDSGSIVYRPESDTEDRKDALGLLIAMNETYDLFAVTPVATILADIQSRTGLDLTFAT